MDLFQLLKIVICPICKKKLFFDKNKKMLICKSELLAYPFFDDIPVLLKNEACRITNKNGKFL